MIRNLWLRLQYICYRQIEVRTVDNDLPDLKTRFVQNILESLNLEGMSGWEESPPYSLFAAILDKDEVDAVLCAYAYESSEQDDEERDALSHLAVSHGETWRYLTKEILAMHPYTAKKDRNGRDALSWACSEGEVDAVHQLIEARGSLVTRDRQNWTPLHHAIASNRLDILESLTLSADEWMELVAGAEFWFAAHSENVSDDTLRFFAESLLINLNLQTCPEIMKSFFIQRLADLKEGAQQTPRTDHKYEDDNAAHELNGLDEANKCSREDIECAPGVI